MIAPVEKSRNFFLLKKQFKSKLSNLEKTVFTTGDDINHLEKLINQMSALTSNSPYYDKKLEKLYKEFNRLISIKKYNQADFNRIFKLTELLDERIFKL